jgi:DNA-binding NarL/FixJ family response regulator
MMGVDSCRGIQLNRLRILVVDESVRFAEAAERFLRIDDRLEVLASVHSGGSALARIKSELPGLVLTDLKMPDMSGVELTRQIKASGCAAKVIIVTLLDADTYGDEARIAGADALLGKGKIATELMTLIGRLFAWDVPAQTPADILAAGPDRSAARLPPQSA